MFTSWCSYNFQAHFKSAEIVLWKKIKFHLTWSEFIGEYFDHYDILHHFGWTLWHIVPFWRKLELSSHHKFLLFFRRVEKHKWLEKLRPWRLKKSPNAFFGTAPTKNLSLQNIALLLIQNAFWRPFSAKKITIQNASPLYNVFLDEFFRG